MSKLSDEGIELLIEHDNSEREGHSDNSEHDESAGLHDELANVDSQPLSFWPFSPCYNEPKLITLSQQI